MRLVDTAGIRDAMDEAESIGVRKTMEAMAEADLALVVLDVSQFSEFDLDSEYHLLEQTRGRPRILVCNKSDLLTPERRLPASEVQRDEHSPPPVLTSAITGEGIPLLRAMVLKKAGADGAQQDSAFLTNIRQQKLVEESLDALGRGASAMPLKIPHEMILLDLYSALRPLDDITGATTADDILNLIFSSFCIGK